MTPATPLRRVQIRQVLLKHRGSISQIARELGISQVTVTMWLKGKTTSARIADAAATKALALMEAGR